MANKTVNRVKVVISGAAGHIAYALIFRILSGQLFGPDVYIDLVLLEVAAMLPALHGVVMEIEDCAFPLLSTLTVTASVQEAMQAVNWALLVGAMPRKAGMERSDLLTLNGHIFAEQGRALNQHAADNVRILVVGNPCNTNCLIAMHHAPAIPRERFYAMTLLDELRARAQLAMKAQVPVSAVTRVAIWGNHSSTQFPDFYHARIHGRAATEVIDDLAWLQQDFVSTVQQRGAKVIEARGTSSAASAANAILQTVYHLTHDTADGEVFSVACYTTGEYAGIQPGLIFSMPCHTKQGVTTVVREWAWNSFSQQQLDKTQQELLAEYHTVKALELLA